MISDYIHEGFEYCLNLDCYTFKQLTINAFVDRMRQDEKGREYLEQCWILTQTDIDGNSLSKMFGKEGGNRTKKGRI